MINVFVNSEQKELESNASLFSLLDRLEYSTKKGIAVAINNQVVRKKEWSNYILKNEDKVTIIRATQGG